MQSGQTGVPGASGLIKGFPTVIRLWNLASLGTAHNCVARIVGTLVKYPAVFVVRGSFAEGARPHKGGWGQAGPHLSRSVGEVQGAQGYQGWSSSRGNFSLPSALSSVQTSLRGSSETTSLIFRSYKLMGPKPPQDQVLPRVVQNLERGQDRAQPRSPVLGGTLEPHQLIQTGFGS